MSNLLSPIEGMLAVLDQGAVTGTNKYGLLLALLELAPEVDPDGVIDLERLATKSIEIQWDHVRPFGDAVLRQVTATKRENTSDGRSERTHRARLVKQDGCVDGVGGGGARGFPTST